MLRCTLDDADIPIGAVAEELQRGLIPLRIVSCDRPVYAIEFDDYHALHNSRLIGFHGIATDKKFTTGFHDRRACELCIRCQRVRI